MLRPILVSLDLGFIQICRTVGGSSYATALSVGMFPQRVGVRNFAVLKAGLAVDPGTGHSSSPPFSFALYSLPSLLLFLFLSFFLSFSLLSLLFLLSLLHALGSSCSPIFSPGRRCFSSFLFPLSFLFPRPVSSPTEPELPSLPPSPFPPPPPPPPILPQARSATCLAIRSRSFSAPRSPSPGLAWCGNFDIVLTIYHVLLSPMPPHTLRGAMLFLGPVFVAC